MSRNDYNYRWLPPNQHLTVQPGAVVKIREGVGEGATITGGQDYRVSIGGQIDDGAHIHLKGSGKLFIRGPIGKACILLEGNAELEIRYLVHQGGHIHLSHCKKVTLGRAPHDHTFLIEPGIHGTTVFIQPRGRTTVLRYSEQNSYPWLLPGGAARSDSGYIEHLRNFMPRTVCGRCAALDQLLD